MGNLRSVQKALESLGFACAVTSDRKKIKSSGGIVLPGVGAFDAGITELRKNNLESVILEEIGSGKPFLGICLGMQLLLSSSEEGKLSGLGVFGGKCRRFPRSGLAVPQMGWNRLIVKNPSAILNGITSGEMMYFANSYYVDPDDGSIIAAETDYGVNFASVISKKNIFGTQFHPEKSGKEGLKILSNFGKLCGKE